MKCSDKNIQVFLKVPLFEQYQENWLLEEKCVTHYSKSLYMWLVFLRIRFFFFSKVILPEEVLPIQYSHSFFYKSPVWIWRHIWNSVKYFSTLSWFPILKFVMSLSRWYLAVKESSDNAVTTRGHQVLWVSWPIKFTLRIN